MAYHGYIPFMKKFLDQIEVPSVLEIGVDKGQTTIPLLHHLLMRKEKFFFGGVDIRLYDEFRVILTYLDRKPSQMFQFFNMNSLDFLKDLSKEENFWFDLILVDGDHNYFTVSKELEFLQKFVKTSTIIVCDDYNGRWAEKDLFYSEIDGYANISNMTTKQETDKHGVRAAIDEFVAQHQEWKIFSLMPGEPVVLSQAEINT